MDVALVGIHGRARYPRSDDKLPIFVLPRISCQRMACCYTIRRIPRPRPPGKRRRAAEESIKATVPHEERVARVHRKANRVQSAVKENAAAGRRPSADNLNRLETRQLIRRTGGIAASRAVKRIAGEGTATGDKRQVARADQVLPDGRGRIVLKPLPDVLDAVPLRDQPVLHVIRSPRRHERRTDVKARKDLRIGDGRQLDAVRKDVRRIDIRAKRFPPAGEFMRGAGNGL